MACFSSCSLVGFKADLKLNLRYSRIIAVSYREGPIRRLFSVRFLFKERYQSDLVILPRSSGSLPTRLQSRSQARHVESSRFGVSSCFSDRRFGYSTSLIISRWSISTPVLVISFRAELKIPHRKSPLSRPFRNLLVVDWVNSCPKRTRVSIPSLQHFGLGRRRFTLRYPCLNVTWKRQRRKLSFDLSELSPQVLKALPVKGAARNRRILRFRNLYSPSSIFHWRGHWNSSGRGWNLRR